MKNPRWSAPCAYGNKLVAVFWIKKIKDMKEEWMKMIFGRFNIKNYHANYDFIFTPES